MFQNKTKQKRHANRIGKFIGNIFVEKKYILHQCENILVINYGIKME
jgi:hypothetical protein